MTKKALGRPMMMMRQYQNTQFLKMPADDQRRGLRLLSGSAFKLMTYFWIKKSSDPFITSEFAARYQMDVKTVAKAHKELQEKGFLFIEQTKGKSIYVLGLANVKEYIAA